MTPLASLTDMTAAEGQCVSGWIDHCNIPGWFDWIAGLLGAAGLIFAIVQLCRSSNALQAARDSYEKTRSTLALNQMLLNHGELEAHSIALDHVLQVVDREPAYVALKQFSKRASELAALLEIATKEHAQTVAGLKSAARAADKGVEWLIQAPPSRINALFVDKAATEMRRVVTDMEGTITTLRSSPMPDSKRRIS